MNKEDVKKRIAELREKTEYYAKKYYDDDDPEITDFEYDMLMVELRNLEAENPEFIDENSLTQKVGGHVKEEFGKVEHEVPLQSLQDVFSIEELRLFDTRIKKDTGKEEITYTVEGKIDGLSVSLEYKNGKLVRGATRGNGTVRRRRYSKPKNNKNNTKNTKRKHKHNSSRRSIHIKRRFRKDERRARNTRRKNICKRKKRSSTGHLDN